MSESGAAPKKVKKEGSSTFGGDGKDYDAATQKGLEEIDTCQNEIDNLNEKASEEIVDVELKYRTIRKPFYEKRNDIIKRIPNFWVTAFVNHPHLSVIIDEDEEDCLHFLTKLVVEEFEDIKAGYRINFHFDENPYFENDVVTKEFHTSQSGDEFCQSTPLRWKEGITKRIRCRRLGKGRKRVIQHSFFGWLEDNCYPYAGYIAEMIRDEMWVNPLKYYLVPEVGNAIEEEDEASDEEVHSVSAEDELQEEEDVGKGGVDNGGGGGDDEDDDDDDDVLIEEDEEGEELGDEDEEGEVLGGEDEEGEVLGGEDEEGEELGEEDDDEGGGE